MSVPLFMMHKTSEAIGLFLLQLEGTVQLGVYREKGTLAEIQGLKMKLTSDEDSRGADDAQK